MELDLSMNSAILRRDTRSEFKKFKYSTITKANNGWRSTVRARDMVRASTLVQHHDHPRDFLCCALLSRAPDSWMTALDPLLSSLSVLPPMGALNGEVAVISTTSASAKLTTRTHAVIEWSGADMGVHAAEFALKAK